MKLFKTILVGCIFAVFTPLFVYGQIPDPVKFKISGVPGQVKAGEVFTVELEAAIEENWNLYSVLNAPDAGPYPTAFSAKSGNFVIAGDIEESQASIEYDPNFDAELGMHQDFARFKIPVAIKADAEGKQTLDINVNYQACDDRVCLPPKDKSIIASVDVQGVADEIFAGLETLGQEKSETEGAQLKSGGADFAGSGILSFMWIALLAGFAALLTPCVFPMIPLTVSYFSKQEETKRGAGRALVFGLAIIATFTVLGVLLAMMLGASGAHNFASNPWINLIIATILIAFAFSLLGMFELRLPYKLTNFLNRKSSESSGMMGILFMALTISAVSFSCTAPFVGAVFAATVGGEWFYPILGMIGFSAAFASPFVLLARFPDWMESLPKSGSWMNIVKVLLGFVELAAAFKFISNADLVWEWGLVSRPFTIAAWIVIFLLAGLYVLGFITLSNDAKPERISTGRLLIAIPLLTFSFYLIPGLLGSSLGIWDSWLPPKQPTDVSLVGSFSGAGGAAGNSLDEGWSQDLEASVEAALAEGKPVFIDFTGYTCTNCRAMESNVFPDSEVQEHFSRMVLVKLYTDGGSDAQKNQKIQFNLTGNIALPTYVIYDPVSERVVEQVLGYTKKSKFISFLKSGLSKFV